MICQVGAISSSFICYFHGRSRLTFVTLKIETVKNNILIIALLAVASGISAQVNAVKYSLKYNPETCLFDCYLNVEEGKTKMLRHRAQFNAQVTIVAPDGSYVAVRESYMPLKDNQEYRSDASIDWIETSLVDAPEAAKDLSFHSFTPTLAPTAFYNDLEAGAEVKLFSVVVDPMVDCASDVRLFDNTRDPNSSQPGMQGGDFTNGFTMGGLNQLYKGTGTLELPTGPAIENFQVTYGKSLAVDFDVNEEGLSQCQKGTKVEWYGPNGLISTGTKAPKLSRADARSGEYTVRVVDALGCATEKTISLGSSAAGIGQELVGGAEGSSVTSTADIYESSSAIYPNPANGFTNISITAQAGVKVTANLCDIEGRVVQSNIVNEVLSGNGTEAKVNLGAVSPGVYTIVIYNDGIQAASHKLLVIE